MNDRTKKRGNKHLEQNPGRHWYWEVISRVSISITGIRGLITPLLTTHEPPSRVQKKTGEVLDKDLERYVDKTPELKQTKNYLAREALSPLNPKPLTLNPKS